MEAMELKLKQASAVLGVAPKDLQNLVQFKVLRPTRRDSFYLKMPRIKRRDTGAMELRPTPARRKLSFRIRNYTRATPAQVASKAKCIRRKNLALWCAWWDRHR